MKKDHILLNELFASLQGEGMYAGTPMLFIRTSTCNLRCSWCDQPDSVAEGFRGHTLKALPTPASDIFQWARRHPDYRHVCITGGEPTLQDLSPLTSLLKGFQYKLHLETNGTHCPGWIHSIDHICLSPKRDSNVHRDMWELASEVKIIIDEDSTIEQVQEVLNIVDEDVPVYLQPANHMNSINDTLLKKTIEMVQMDPWQLRLSVQMHKVLGVH